MSRCTRTGFEADWAGRAGKWPRSPYPSKALDVNSGGCVRKAVELTSGGLPLVVESRLRTGQPVLTGRQKSAEGVVAVKAVKARTVPARG